MIGQHRVIRGPNNPNVFQSCQQFPLNPSQETKNIQEEIMKMLAEPVSRSSDTAKQQVSKRCKALASFMETLMDEVTASADLKIEMPQVNDLTFSERDSVMLGEISPHHDYFDSKSSSETPPSYNQLNYNENLQRFFDSRPVTTLTDEYIKMEVTDTEGDARTNLSPVHCGGSGGSESAGNSSGSNAQMESVTNTSTGTSSESNSYKTPTLTEALLFQHNEQMEKLIIKKHKVSRSGGKNGEKNKKGPDKQQDQQVQHGVKRSGSHLWEGEAYKTSKYQHFSEAQKDISSMRNQFNQQMCGKNVDLWPPFSVQSSVPQHYTTVPAVYYIPQSSNQPQEQNSSFQIQYFMAYPHPTMMYHPLPFQAVNQSNMTDPNPTSAYNVSLKVLYLITAGS